MAKAILTDYDFSSVARLLNVPIATEDGQPVVYEQLKAALEALVWKDSARVRTSSNVNISAPGATLDGVTMVSGDRVLVSAQTTAAENGIRIWTGADTPMTRAADASTMAELKNAVVPVYEGSSAGATFRQATVSGTIDVTDIVWQPFGTGAPSATETVKGIVELATQAEVDAGTASDLVVTPQALANSPWVCKSAESVIGDGSATSFTVTHNYGTRDVSVTVFRNSGNYDEVEVEVRRPTVNTVQVIFATAPSASAFVVVVAKK